jgi:hypothetical protein
MMTVPDDTRPEWDARLAMIETNAQRVVARYVGAVLGIAVEDEGTRDYFVSRLQAIVDTHEWARDLTFRVVPVDRGDPVDVRRQWTRHGEGTSC